METVISANGGTVFLRPILPSDLDILEAWENDPLTWAATDFSEWTADEQPPYSSAVLRQFIENQQLGIEHCGQLRLVVCLRDGRPAGFVDLFDYDPAARTAQVGILIYSADDRGRGYGTEAVQAVCEYAFGELGILELRCAVGAENETSRRVFEKCGFVFDGKNLAGCKKNTIF